MSIFPKRSVPGSIVTIHWNFNTSLLKDTHIIPWVRIGVKDPLGKVTMLFEDHVLALPDPKDEGTSTGKQLKYLNKNIPLLILAEYLEGHHSREKLIDILQNIQSGKHYYFTFSIDQNAPLGKYTLISEIHNNGEVRYSNTAAEDFFLVEKVGLKCMESDEKTVKAVVFNYSTEKTPVKIVNVHTLPSGGIKTSVEVFELEPLAETAVLLTSETAFLVYNEERQVIPLNTSPVYLLRNQEVLQVHKNDNLTYLFKKSKEEAYQLEGDARALWNKADGLLNINNLTEEEKLIFDEMRSEKLIQELNMSQSYIPGGEDKELTVDGSNGQKNTLYE